MKRFKNKKILILGAGSSGKSAYSLLKSRNISATLYDDSNKDLATNPKDQTTSPKDFDICVISPGVPSTHPFVQHFKSYNPIISELELGFMVKHRKIIAITGTNGKSTVTQNIAKAINLNKNPFARKAIACGNIGIPVTSVTKELKRKTAVTEVSSFQLESIQAFRPNISVILNITQDHLERHNTMEEYIRCKSQIFANQTQKDVLILNYDDENCKNLASQTIAKVLWFSTQARVHGIYMEGKNIIWNVCGKAKKIFTLDDISDHAQYNIQNALATIMVCRLLKISKHAIKLAINTSKMEHRLQYVGKLTKPDDSHSEIIFYNDSKATNIASTLAACKCFETQIQLLVGGLPKGQNFTELFKKLPKNVATVFAFGTAAPEIIKSHTELSKKHTANSKPQKANPQTQPPEYIDLPKIHKCKNLAKAVTIAIQTANGPSVILLSPACSSLDEYKNYAARGNHFIELVYKTISEKVKEPQKPEATPPNE